MRLTTLIENYVEQKSLIAEHGFSILIDTGSKKILFDTGQTGNFLLNAYELGIDMKEIDYVVLSHGHYDHTGGLYEFLQINSKALLICKEEIFVPKYNATEKYIGISWREEVLKHRTMFINTVMNITEHVFIFPHIPIHYRTDTHFENLTIRKEGIFTTDEMLDELFIVIRCDDTISVVTACSHRGITNICKTATDYFNLPIHLITGGFHLRNCSRQQYLFIVHCIQKLKPKMIGTCHCTGVDKFSSLQKDLQCPVFYNYTGRNIIL